MVDVNLSTWLLVDQIKLVDNAAAAVAQSVKHPELSKVPQKVQLN